MAGYLDLPQVIDARQRFAESVKRTLEREADWILIGQGPDIERMASGMRSIFHSTFPGVVIPHRTHFPAYLRRETRLSLQGIGNDITIIETKARDESNGYVVVDSEEVGTTITPEIYRNRIEGALSVVWSSYAQDSRKKVEERVIDFKEMIAGFAWRRG